MPVVPRPNLPTATAPLSSARLSSDAPPSAFAPPTPINLEPVTKLAATVWDDNKQKADQIAVMDADAALSKFETTLLYDPKTGLLNKRGKDSFGIPEEATAAWSKQMSEIEKNLTGDTQKLAFRKMAQQRQGDMDVAVKRHVAGEMKSYDDTTTKEYVAGEQDAALINYQDPKRVALSVARQQDAIRLFAQRNGLPQEWIDTNVAEVASKTHTKILDRLLANGEDQKATDYYSQYKGQIVGADTIAIEKALDEGSTRGVSQRQADQIVAGTQSRADALKQVDQIKDPKIRDATRQRVNQHFDEVRAIERETQDKLYLTSTNLLDARPNTPARFVIPPSIWSKLSLEQRSALERRSEGGGPNDDHKWLQFLDLHPVDLGKMTQPEFETAYWSHFDGPHRERAALQWAAARDAVSQAKFKQPVLASTLTFKDRINNTLKATKLIDDKPLAKLSKDQRQSFMAIETEAAHQIEEYEMNQLGGKRRATGDEMQTIIDNLVKNRVFLDKNWIRSDPEKVAALVTADEKGLAYVPFDKVPADSRASIENLLKSRGRRITRDVIQRAYAAHLLNDRALFDSIIGGAPTAAANVPVAPAPVPPPLR